MPSVERNIAFGMSTIRYRTTPDKADLIENMVVTKDGTLKSMTGPTLYEPRHIHQTTPVALGTVHAVFHGYFNGGDKEVLLIHAGNTLYSHEGAKRGWVEVEPPHTLRNDSQQSAYSTFAKFGELIIFSDGAGPPIVIDSALRCMHLGFALVPSSPSVRGPESGSHSEEDGEGALGYSWPGGLGTHADGLSGDRPAILKGAWSWCVRYQDFYGNYSALSLPSAQVEYGPKRAEPAISENWMRTGSADFHRIKRTGLEIKGLKRAAAVDLPDDVPPNCKLIEIGRTRDTERNTSDFYLVHAAGASGGAFHDRKRDSRLVVAMKETWPVPVFKSFLVDNGRLVVASGPYIYLSEPGFPGTFAKADRLMLTADGRQSTAVFALSGRRYAATKNSITDVTDLTSPIVISSLIGISGPKAWTYLPGEAGIVFVSESGVFTLSKDGLANITSDIDGFWQDEVNKTRLQSTVVWYSKDRQEVRIAVTPSGDTQNTLILAYSGLGWRTYRLGISVNCVTYIEDMEAIGGTDGQTRGLQNNYTGDDVYILERETPMYTPPARQAIYESDYIPIDETLGFVRGKILSIFFGFVETYADIGATLEYEINYDTGIAETHLMRLDDSVGVDIMDGETRRHSWDSFLVGTDNFHEKRKVYRKARIDLSNVNRFKFRLYTDYPVQVEMVDYLFEFNVDNRAGYREIDATEV